MKHYGDITKISGANVPPVDVVIGGSPCQNLSIAGKREGLAGAESCLFLEQIRLIKEMRDADIQRGRTGQLIRPRFMLWKNVVGAFSSNKGDDVRVVLEETIRIAEPNAPNIPLPPKGRWPMADAWYGDGWSIAYRVLDAQFWGVPQRRRRIALVADFGGHAAPEILFVRKSVCGDIAPGGAERKRTPAGTGGYADRASAYRIGAYFSAGMTSPNPRAGIVQTDISCTLDCNGGSPASQQGGICIVQPKNVLCLNDQGRQSMSISADIAGTLRAQEHGHQPIVAFAQNQLGEVRTGAVAGTLNTNSNASGRNAPLVYDARGNGDGKIACTITGDHEGRITDYTAIVVETGQGEKSRPGLHGEIAGTLDASYYKGPGMRGGVEREVVLTTPSIARPLTANHNPAREDMATYPITSGVLRRLTPLECERLQGYPDGWTDIGEWRDTTGKLHKKSSDTARYKALGNSIALPPWAWVLKRLCACYERPATMASLFDGIGGFPLLWEQLNGPGTCLWASEIEEFPIAVTQRRFSEGSETQ